MRATCLLMLLPVLCLSACMEGTKKEYEVTKSNLRAPAWPLVTIDPYTSAWSMTDNLYDSQVKHWTGKDFPLLGVIKVDGQPYRFMGEETVEMDVVVPTSEQQAWEARYTTSSADAGLPSGETSFAGETFNDAKWKTGTGAFGTIARHHERDAKTEWDTEHIWVRRTVEITEQLNGRNLYLVFTNDDDAVFYINGIRILERVGCCNKNAIVKIPKEAADALRTGTNLIAAYCHNPVANGMLDFGILVERPNASHFNQTATQMSVDAQATQTHYTFTCGGVNLNLTFSAPLFMDDLALMSRPVNYITYNVETNDGQPHDVQVYFEASPRWALDQPHQESVSEIIGDGNLLFLKSGSKQQDILGKRGDDLRIDWGYFYMAAEKTGTLARIGESSELRSGFVNGTASEGSLTGENRNSQMAFTVALGSVQNHTGKVMVGYDDIYSLQYFGENLRPYWNSDGKQTIIGQFHDANTQYSELIDRCYAFDKKLMDDATQAGGTKYAELCALAYRQSIAAHKLAKAPNGDLLFMSKENNSNGSIGTVDVTYPSTPLYLYYNPELAKGLLNHIFYYSESGKWTKPFAAHDVGTYPLANGQTYGGDMPVEESGNMLVTTAAIAHIEGNANYAEKHWEVLTVWTDYLVEKGLDPENQLCTDDFAGHFAHNANLSIKAIMGIASYGKLAAMLGKNDVAEKYTAKAKEMAQQWITMADNGDHYRLTFDKEGTWSQKYNMVWNKILKMDVFPNDVAQKEIAYYLGKQNKYGLPLDNRETYTKTDWIMWTATMASDRATFEKFIDPVHLFMNETTNRIPMSDWVYTDRPNFRGFKARSVVGGYFIKMLDEKLNR